MKQLLIILSVLVVQFVWADDVVYQISATKDGETTKLDSILFNNISNNTQWLLDDLQEQDRYDINMSTQTVVTNLSKLRLYNLFTLVKNTYGAISVAYNGSKSSKVYIEVFNIKGQMLFSNAYANCQQLTFDIFIPNKELYLVQLRSEEGTASYKAIGKDIVNHISVSTSLDNTTQIALKASNLIAETESDFAIGDTLEITGYLSGYLEQVFFLVIAESTPITFEFTVQTGEVSDVQGNKYKTVKLGNKFWMAQNYSATMYNDGTAIAHVSDGVSWMWLNTPAYCYHNNSAPNAAKYGAMYNWYTVDKEGLCPTGWHVSTLQDWTDLKAFLVTEGYSGKDAEALRSKTGWFNTTGSDPYGFNAKPGGYRYALETNGYFKDTFVDTGYDTYWWTPDEFADFSAGVYYGVPAYLGYAYSEVYAGGGAEKINGYYVRCVED